MDKHEHVGCALNFAHTAQCSRSKKVPTLPGHQVAPVFLLSARPVNGLSRPGMAMSRPMSLTRVAARVPRAVRAPVAPVRAARPGLDKLRPARGGEEPSGLFCLISGAETLATLKGIGIGKSIGNSLCLLYMVEFGQERGIFNQRRVLILASANKLFRRGLLNPLPLLASLSAESLGPMIALRGPKPFPWTMPLGGSDAQNNLPVALQMGNQNTHTHTPWLPALGS